MKKPSSICQQQLRSIAIDKQPLVKIENRQMIKDIVTDFVIRSLSSPLQHSTLQRTRKYQPFPVDIEVNGEIQHYQLALTTVLEKYVTLAKASSERNNTIEGLVGDILQLTDQMTQNAIMFKVSTNIRTPEVVLAALISKHLKEKQKQQLEGDYLQAKKKMNGKHRKVLLKQRQSKKQNKVADLLCEKDSDKNSHRMSRTSVEQIDQEELYKKFMPTPASSKLKQIVDSCNIFDHPDKLEALKKEKIIAEYCKDQVDYENSMQQIVNGATKYSDSTLNPGVSRFLQDWINEIDLSQYLFNRKHGFAKGNHSDSKKKRSDSSSEEEVS